MPTDVFNTIRSIDKEFYEANASSFSQTRAQAWQGWEILANELGTRIPAKVKLLDLAAGNGRFEEFIARRFPDIFWQATCVDSCDPLLNDCKIRCADAALNNLCVALVVDDILEATTASASQTNANKSSANWYKSNTYNLIVSFGFMHHIYSATMREEFLHAVVNCACSGAYIALSFWRFAEDESFAHKAAKETTAALSSPLFSSQAETEVGDALEDGDYLLGWQGDVQTIRYCHSFTSEEIDQLLALIARQTRIITRYRADGRTNDLNEYVILEKI